MQMRLFILLFLLLSNLQFSLLYARSQFTLPPAKYALTVKTTPSHAIVKIMNIKPSYHHGIKLKAGDYRIEVSAQGYDTQKKTVKLTDRDKTIYIALNPTAPLVSKEPPLLSTDPPVNPPYSPEKGLPAGKVISILPDNNTDRQQQEDRPTKQKFTHTKGYQRFLNHANRLYGISYNDPRFIPYCKQYARLAVRQARRRLSNHCEKEISVFHNDQASQWQLKKAPQESWCRTVSSHATYKESIYREERLEYCIAGYILRSKY